MTVGNGPVPLTRGHPYRKNDRAHVEQKNWTHVRQLLGYQRLEQPELIPLPNDLYRTWGLCHNFFCPTLKLRRKVRQGSKTRRQYCTPQTPASWGVRTLMACQLRLSTSTVALVNMFMSRET